MKIVIDGRMWNETGIGRYIRNLVYGLESIDATNDYYILLLENEYKNLKFKANFNKILADIKWYTLNEQIKLYQIVSKISPDVFHAPNINFPVFYNGKMIVTVHDLIMIEKIKDENLERMVKRVILKFLLKYSLKKVSSIITVSNYIKKVVLSDFQIDRSKINTIYNCIKPSQNLHKKFNIKSDYIVYVGNTYGHKNVEFLVSSIKDIGKKLVIVGKEDKSIKHLKNIVKDKKLESLVTFTGFVDDKELSKLYSNAYAFVFPTLKEGFGLPGLESMNFDCPVVCSDIQVLREIYKDGALFFKANNLESLKEQLKKLENSGFQIDLIKKGRDVVKRYKCNTFINSTLQIYQKIGSYK